MHVHVCIYMCVYLKFHVFRTLRVAIPVAQNQVTLAINRFVFAHKYMVQKYIIIYVHVHLGCLGSSAGRALCPVNRVAWVRIPPEAHFF